MVTMAKRKLQNSPAKYAVQAGGQDAISGPIRPKKRMQSTMTAPIAPYLANVTKSTRLSTPLRAKIEIVQRFSAQEDRNSLIPQSTTHEGQVTVSNTALLAALMMLCADWDLKDPMSVNICDLTEAISETGHLMDVTLDLSKTTVLERRIRDSLPGYGLEQTSLLGFELERYYTKLASMTSADPLRHGA